MIDHIREQGTKLRNLFIMGKFQKRYAESDKKDFIQVKTHKAGQALRYL
ncbi:MAG: hypothetical protein LBD74_06325 [Spirochaetaceae bacterium]|nr:hypothetical protein [Spirochaetaceae bacterium]